MTAVDELNEWLKGKEILRFHEDHCGGLVIIAKSGETIAVLTNTSGKLYTDKPLYFQNRSRGNHSD